MSRRFSSMAESHWYSSMGASVIGMTNMPDATLAREAKMAYATLAMQKLYNPRHPERTLLYGIGGGTSSVSRELRAHSWCDPWPEMLIRLFPSFFQDHGCFGGGGLDGRHVASHGFFAKACKGVGLGVER